MTCALQHCQSYSNYHIWAVKVIAYEGLLNALLNNPHLIDGIMPEPPSREERDLENTPSIAIEGECYLVPGPVKMSNKTLNSMSCPVMTARGTEFRDVMAELNGLLRIAFNLSHSNFERGTESFQGDDNYSIIIVSGSGTAAMEMVIANRFSKEDSLLVPTNGKFGERVAELANTFSQVNNLKFEWGQSFDLNVI